METKPGVCVEMPEVGMVLLDAINVSASGVATLAASAEISAEVIVATFVLWSAPVSCASFSSCAMFAADDAAAPLVASGGLTPCNVAGACASTLPRSTAPDIAPPAAVADDAAFAALLVALAALANNAPALAARDASTVVLGNADSLCAARASA